MTTILPHQALCVSSPKVSPSALLVVCDTIRALMPRKKRHDLSPPFFLRTNKAFLQIFSLLETGSFFTIHCSNTRFEPTGTLPSFSKVNVAYRYANFYVARPPIQERVVRSQYATLARNHTAAWLLGAVSRPSEPVVMAYLGRDSKIHVIHCIVEHVASLEYPSMRFEGNFIGLMDKVGEFGANLGAIDGEPRPLLWRWQQCRRATSWR
jgi:hypothetical protein